MVPLQPGTRRFTPERVHLLRALHDSGLTSISHLARECGVAYKTMAQVVKRQSYREVREYPGYLHYHANMEVLGVKVPSLEVLMEMDRGAHGYSV